MTGSSLKIINNLCKNARKRQFSDNERDELLKEITILRGDIECLACCEWRSRTLFAHHIIPWSMGGPTLAWDGALLCGICHNFADDAVISPLELFQLKGGKPPFHEIITSKEAIEDLLNSAPVVEGQETQTCDQVIDNSLEMLSKLRNCRTDNPKLRREWRRAVARQQLKMAGGLTSREPAEKFTFGASKRYAINMLATNVVRLGKYLYDDFLKIQGFHSLTTNAIAERNLFGYKLEDAIRYSKKILNLLPRLESQQREYVSYTYRNISIPFEIAGMNQQANELINNSRRLNDDDIELCVREGQILTMRLDFQKAERLLEKWLCKQSSVAIPIRKVIGLRIYGLHQCLAGRQQGLTYLHGAHAMAVKNHLGHQGHKIYKAIEFFQTKNAQNFILHLRKGKSYVHLPEKFLFLF